MKALPKRKGNRGTPRYHSRRSERGLNESPSEKEGKSINNALNAIPHGSLNESPSEKEGKFSPRESGLGCLGASMKALPKRKGNRCASSRASSRLARLNESPSEKEGKSQTPTLDHPRPQASMKALPKRKGNKSHTITEPPPLVSPQ